MLPSRNVYKPVIEWVNDQIANTPQNCSRLHRYHEMPPKPFDNRYSKRDQAVLQAPVLQLSIFFFI